MAWRLGTPMSHYIIFVEIKNIVEKKAEGGGEWAGGRSKKKRNMSYLREDVQKI